MIHHSFIKFLLVGVINTIVGLSIMYFCYNLLDFTYWSATFIGNAIGAVVSFFLNKNFTFQSKVALLPSMIRFIAVILFCYFVSYKLGLEITEWALTMLGYSNELTEQLAILFGSGLYTIMNYFGQRLFVFKQKKSTEQVKG